MPINTTTSYNVSANSEVTQEIWLYRISVNTDPLQDLFLAEYPEDVLYFKDTNTPQIYRASSLRHEGLTTNTKGQLEPIKVSLPNNDPAMQQEVENYTGLRGSRVVVRRVSLTNLTDPLAHIEDVAAIDGCDIGPDGTLSFTLSSKLDIMKARACQRTYSRSTCQFDYAGLGCFEDDGLGNPRQPTAFDPIGYAFSFTQTGTPTATIVGQLWSNTNGHYYRAAVVGSNEIKLGEWEEFFPNTCAYNLYDCRRHKNSKRFGGFPSVPRKMPYFG